ncbi:MAG: DUF975 family protein [Planctomycetota bacterium]|nr:DUF975 family protein [Planctomycetota bacterium]
MATWYCSIDGTRYGPVEESVLQEWIREGRVHPATLIWTAGMEQWLPAGSVPGFFIGGAAPQAAPPYSLVPAAPLPASGGGMPNELVCEDARKRLTGNWILGMGASLIVVLVPEAANYLPVIGAFAGPIVALILTGPVQLGVAAFFLTLARGGRADLGTVFVGFRYFGNALAAHLLMTLFIFLWALLLIIPGIIAGLAYSQTFYLMAEDTRLGPMEALRLSKQIMMGHKWKLFCLGWRFFGWMILSILTCCIGFLWLMPYMATAYARFHDDVHSHTQQAPTA